MPEHQYTQQSIESKSAIQKQRTLTNQALISNPMAIIQRAKINPKSLTHADVMQLQRTIGNRAVGRLLSSIGSSSTSQQAIVQRQEIPEEEEPLQGKMAEAIQRQEIPEEEEPLQGKFESKPKQLSCLSCFVAPIVQRQEMPEEKEPLQGKFTWTIQRQELPEEEPLQPKRENNTGMLDNLKAGVENLSGIDMSDVRAHCNSSKPVEEGALAYTRGTNIHVSPGQERHLQHEAWHVVQQKQRKVQPTMQLKDIAVNDDDVFEQEADVMGTRVLDSKTDFINEKNNVKPYLCNNLVIQRKMIFSGDNKERIETAWLQAGNYDKTYTEFFNTYPFEFKIEGTDNSKSGVKAETIKAERKIIIYEISQKNEGQLLRLITHELEHMYRTLWDDTTGNFIKDKEDDRNIHYHDVLLKFAEGEKEKNERILNELNLCNKYFTMIQYINEMMEERIAILRFFKLNDIAKDIIYIDWVEKVKFGIDAMIKLRNNWMEKIMKEVHIYPTLSTNPDLGRGIKHNNELSESLVKWYKAFDSMQSDMNRLSESKGVFKS